MKIIIAGLGFVGESLANALLAEGHTVIGLTQSPSSVEKLRRDAPGLEVRQADIADPSSLRKALPEPEAARANWVVHCASSGRGGAGAYQRVYRDGLARLRDHCPEARLLFTSSTSVYAQADGSWVDETSPAQPERETGQILRQAEGIVLESEGGIVARLAGIYGPGRSYILLKFLNQTAVIEGDGGRYVNQAHRDDIVSGLHHLMTKSPATDGIFNIVDSVPQTQRQIYQWLADHFQRGLPPQAPPDYERKRGWTHKRVSNERLRASGWSPQFPSFQDAVVGDRNLVPSIHSLIPA